MSTSLSGRIWRTLGILGMIVCLATESFAQQPTLSITSPAERAVVHTSESFSVMVQGSNAKFVRVTVIPPDPIRLPEIRRAPPFAFTFSIPEDMRPGLYLFTATGATDSDQRVTSKQVRLDIERPEKPVSIRAVPDGPFNLRLGQWGVIDVIGKYRNGSTTILNQSTNTSFLSEDPKVVAIHDYGVLIGVAQGSTNIFIRVDDKVEKKKVTVAGRE